MASAPSKPGLSSTTHVLHVLVVNKSQLLGAPDASYLKRNQVLDFRVVMTVLKAGFCAGRGCFGDLIAIRWVPPSSPALGELTSDSAPRSDASQQG